MRSPTVLAGLEITGAIRARHLEIPTPGACAFVAGLAKKFGACCEELLARRVARQAALDAGALYDRIMAEALAKTQGAIGAEHYARGNIPKAVEMFLRMVKADKFDEFLTLRVYEQLA
jgi:malate synthase